MSDRFELHLQDSELQTLHADPTSATLTLKLSAAFARRDDGVTGYLRGVSLVFTGARWSGPLADGVGRITGGQVMLATGARLTRWPLPATFTGGLQAELVFGHGTLLSLSAGALHCTLRGGAANFTESLAC